jgi:hypothetical protein
VGKILKHDSRNEKTDGSLGSDPERWTTVGIWIKKDSGPNGVAEKEGE